MTTDGSLFRWQKQGSVAGGAGGRPVRWQECATGKGHQHRSGCYLPPPNWRKLVRKLKKQSRCLCSEATAGSRPAAFHCHYDPMSYAQNFDRGLSAAGSEDSDHFRAFSARFVMTPPPKTPPPQLAAGAAIATSATTTTTPNSVATTTTNNHHHLHHH
ncbi:uncharacterized protein LOC116246344 [Nymphaea colorata]|nr:uncharacterized protein LOC116246344 [Nymphaea colorata]